MYTDTLPQDKDMKINVKEARRRFSELLNRAEHGEDVVVTRRGKSAVRLVVAVKGQPRHPLPDLSQFRTSIKVRGRLTESLLKDREDARY